MDSIRVAAEDPRGAIPTALIAELSAELKSLYPHEDGLGAFKPDDVLVPRAAFVVAWDCDHAIGCGALRPMQDSNVGEIKRMYVCSAARGKGISRLILFTLEDLARSFGYHALMLETGILQPEAIGLYGSSGYERIDCYGIYTNEPISVCYKKIF